MTGKIEAPFVFGVRVEGDNVTRLKKSLTEKDLITTDAPRQLVISDPILKMWLKRRLWREP